MFCRYTEELGGHGAQWKYKSRVWSSRETKTKTYPNNRSIAPPSPLSRVVFSAPLGQTHASPITTQLVL